MNPSPFSDSLAKKLLFYSLGVGAASAATSHAAVVTTVVGTTGANFQFNIQNTVAPNTTGGNGTIAFGTNEQFAIAASTGKGVNGRDTEVGASSNYLAQTQARTSGAATPQTRYYVLALGAGTTIGAGTGTFTQGTGGDGGYTRNYFNDATVGTPKGDWTAGKRAFVGFEILNPINGTTPLYFGFADITVNNFNNPTGGTAAYTLNGYAYNNTVGASITTFVIPEPASSTALLVAGAAGVAALRRRRQASSDA